MIKEFLQVHCLYFPSRGIEMNRNLSLLMHFQKVTSPIHLSVATADNDEICTTKHQTFVTMQVCLLHSKLAEIIIQRRNPISSHLSFLYIFPHQ